MKIQLVILLTKSYNHRLALCFTYLITQFENFKKCSSLLLNLSLLLQSSNVKLDIFGKVW